MPVLAKWVLGQKGPMPGFHDTTLIEEAEYSINFTKKGNKFCLSLQYNGNNKYFFINGILRGKN